MTQVLISFGSLRMRNPSAHLLIDALVVDVLWSWQLEASKVAKRQQGLQHSSLRVPLLS